MIWPFIRRADMRVRKFGVREPARQATNAQSKWLWLTPPEKAWPPFRPTLPVEQIARVDAGTGANMHPEEPAAKARLQALYADWQDRLHKIHAGEMASAHALVAARMPAEYGGEIRLAQARGELAGLKAQHRQTLEIAFAEESDAEDEFIRFRREHELERGPRHPRGRGLLIGLLSLIVIVEALLASPLFIASKGNHSIFDAFATSVFVSVAIVALGVVTGFVGFRYAGFRIKEQPIATRLWKALGLGVVFAGVSLAGALAWHLALSRLTAMNVVQAASEQTNTAARIVAGFTEMMSPMSAVLAFAGLTLFTFVFAVAKSYSGFADPFPFYSAVSENRDHARKAFQSCKEAYYRSVIEFLDAKFAMVQADLEGEVGTLDEISQIGYEARAWDRAARQTSQAAKTWLKARFRAYDAEFEAVAAHRPGSTPDPASSADPFADGSISDGLQGGEPSGQGPDFDGDLKQAREQHEQNRTAHEAVMREMRELIEDFTLNSDKEIEDWLKIYYNRFRPYGASSVVGRA